MADYFANFGFVTGELSPRLMFRSDLEKYDFGIKTANNFFIDYRGGATVRPPLEFVDRIPGTSVRLIPFRFNLKKGNTLILVFSSDGQLYFFQNGAYILEADVTVSSVTNSIFATSSAHGYTSGQVIKLTGTGDNVLFQRTFLVVVQSATTFSLTDFNGNAIEVSDATYTSAVANVAYSIAHGISASAFRSIVYDQFQDDLYLTSNDFFPKILRRTSNTSWSISSVSFGIQAQSPVNLTATPETTGTAGAVYSVTSTNLDGEESAVGEYLKVTNSNNITSAAGSVLLTWSPVEDTSSYQVYRSLFYSTATRTTIAQELGFLGRTQSPSFIDNNIIPDFTTPPPVDENPFASGAVLHINVTAGGTGYNASSTISISGGSGFVGQPVVDSSGSIIGVVIIKGGSGYTASSTVTASVGSGATFTLSVSPSSGNFPAATLRMQQRRYYFGTTAAPIQLWASKIAQQENFGSSLLATAADAFTLPIDSPDLTPIKYASSLSDNLIIFMASQVSLLRGADDQVLAVGSIKEDTLTTVGIADVMPLKFQDSLLYVSFGSTSVYSISPTNLRNYFKPDERSIYSNHLFKENNPVVAWASMPSPHRLVCGVYENGKGFIMTYVPEQNVYGFTRMFTDGLMYDIAAVQENFYDYGYVAVDRGDGLFLERFIPILIESVEDLGATDSHLTNKLITQTEKVIPVGQTKLTTVNPFFSNADVGKHARIGNGRALITKYNNERDVDVVWQLPATQINEQTGEILASENWTLDPLVNEISGLWHLEGREVAIVVDGNQQPSRIVTNGKVPLQNAGSRVMAGLNYNGYFATLPFTASDVILQSRKKNVKEAGLYLHESRGLFVASTNSPYFYEMKERTSESYGLPTTPLNGMKRTLVQGKWDTEVGVAAEKRAPFIASILGVVASVEIGDND